MSLIFAPFARLNGGKVPISVGVGVPASSTTFQSLKVSDSGYIYAVMDGVVAHYANGLPFDVNGRLVITQNAPVRYNMSVPFGANDAVSGGQ
jgi:hypothetical protein